MYLAIVGVVKNEELYLREWVEFHLKQGVSRFYLTDNNSTDSTREVLAELRREYPVYWYVDPQSPVQFRAYTRWLRVMKHDDEAGMLELPRWVSFLDCDEFLYSPKGKVSDTLRNYEDAAAVQAHWVLYGGSGDSYSPVPVVERCTHRAKEVNFHTKAVVDPRRTIGVGQNPHYFKVTGDTVDENGNKFGPNFSGLQYDNPTADLLRINHYHVKSKEEYYLRKSTKPDPGSGEYRSQEWIHEMYRTHNLRDVVDLTALEASK